MNPVFNGVIQRKLSLLDAQVSQLERHLKGVAREQFVEDWALRSMTERALQVAIEILIDVAERIIAIRGGGPVATAAEAMERLVQFGVLESADAYVRMARFRNLLVHQYADIDPGAVYDLATTRLGEFRRFRDAVDRAAILKDGREGSV